MFTLRRSMQRHEDRTSQRIRWLTFHDQAADAQSFGGLVLLNEARLQPAAVLLRPNSGRAELITYLLEGTLEYEDSNGRARWLRAGEFRCLAAARAGAIGRNSSPTESVHVFQVELRSSARLQHSDQQKRFTVAERRGGWCLVASPGAWGAWLCLQGNVRVYSALLDSGQHVVHALQTGRRAWLHVVRGEVTLHELTLSSGDGVGITAERSVPVTSVKAAELLLIDLA